MKIGKDSDKNEREYTLFRRHIVMFIIVILILWTLWFVNAGAGDQGLTAHRKFPWPVWPTVIWLMALRIHYSAINAKKKKIN